MIQIFTYKIPFKNSFKTSMGNFDFRDGILVCFTHQNHKYYCDIFSNKKYLELDILPYHKDLSCFGFPFVFTSGRMRSTVVKALLEAGIDSRPIIGCNFLNQPVMRKINHVADGYGYEMAEAIDKRGLMIGNYAEDLRKKLDQVDYILESVT